MNTRCSAALKPLQDCLRTTIIVKYCLVLYIFKSISFKLQVDQVGTNGFGFSTLELCQSNHSQVVQKKLKRVF